MFTVAALEISAGILFVFYLVGSMIPPIATLSTDCCNPSAAGAMLGPCQKHVANSHLQSSYGTKHLNVPSRISRKACFNMLSLFFCLE